MSRLFKAKVRRVGTSLGVLIPKEMAEEEKIKEGEEVKIGLFKEKRLEDVLELMGTAKGTKPFNRNRADKVDRYFS
ncbi:MAG: AbrB/MazE/SpoVT family DNA-binding domain-containing protein [Thaumarchaeota archaeon]|nr:AbrB/MazE/SpoVT family DNA-binding domain-containing protein [Nitrososphaerota archaeon]